MKARPVGVRARCAVGAVVGLLAAGGAVGVGELVAALVRPAASPVIAVGNRFVLLTPEPVKQWAIRNFGTHDKDVLLAGIYVVIALFAVVVGILAVHRLWLGVVGTAVFGAVGVWSALTVPARQAGDAVPSVLAALAGAVILRELVRAASEPESAQLDASRRQFLQGSVATAGLALAAGFGGRYLQRHRFSAATARAAVVLPPAAQPAPPLPNGADLGRSAVPFDTPNAAFYRVDTALSIPQVNPTTWRLRVHGMVEHELNLSYPELLARPLVERWITLCCVSNPVGGPLISTSRFLGVRLADLLREAGLRPGAEQLLATSVDGMTIGAPAAVVMDGRDALLAVGMNGEPLTVEHGFPVRMIVPGLYGYVSACKWIVDLRATSYADAAYWVGQGWTSDGRVVLASRIDTPTPSRPIMAGTTVPIAGVAWDQHVGVSKVEVQVDGGAWQPARLAPVPSADTWRQWVLPWTVTSPGQHTLRVRATDAHGRVQDTRPHDPYPGAATGLHTVTVHARAA